MVIRKASTKDLDIVTDIDAATLGSDRRKRYLRSAIKTGKCHVWEYGNTIKGFVVFNYTFYGYGFVTLIGVAPEHQRQGIGTEMMLYAASICTSKKIFTSTKDSNKAMKMLCIKLDYERSGEIENLYAQGNTEVVYCKVLKA
jgi:ribosomal protein S18 acetylase RimI-like enzyme